MKKYLSAFLIINIVFLSSCANLQQQERDAKKASEIYADLGYQYMQKGLEEKSIQNFRKSLEYFSNNHRSLHGLALIMQARKENKLAKEYYEKSLKLSSNNLVYLYNYALFLYERQDYANAIKYLETASKDKLDENRGNILLLRGLTLINLSRYSEAEDILLRASQINATKRASEVALFDVYIKNKQFDKANKLLNDIKMTSGSVAVEDLAKILENAKLEYRSNNN